MSTPITSPDQFLDICNGCEAALAVPGDPAGYCEDCHAEATAPTSTDVIWAKGGRHVVLGDETSTHTACGREIPRSMYPQFVSPHPQGIIGCAACAETLGRRPFEPGQR